jgi:hypothetical protein
MRRSPEPKKRGRRRGLLNLLRAILTSYLNFFPLGVRKNDEKANSGIRCPDRNFNRSVNLNCEQLPCITSSHIEIVRVYLFSSERRVSEQLVPLGIALDATYTTADFHYDVYVIM